jgi:hypothetical protein
MSSPTFPESALSWRKSSYSSGGGNDCVEVAGAAVAVAVRDSKNPGGGAHVFSRRDWRGLTRRIKAGQLDL